MGRLHILVYLFAFCCLAACRPPFTDVTRDPLYKGVLGKRFEVVGTVDAYGIRRHSRAPVDYIDLIPPPGIASLMVGFRQPLPLRATFRITGVLLTNRIDSSPLTYVVQFDGAAIPYAVPVHLDLFRGNEGKGKLDLNPALYRPLVSASPAS